MHHSSSMTSFSSSQSMPSRAVNSFIAPSELMRSRASTPNEDMHDAPSPHASPQVPSKTILAAQFTCKVFLKTSHAQWKSLGAAKTRLYVQRPSRQKQLVAQNDKTTLISTIVLAGTVERVGKTGVAVELSDNGTRAGIVYMLQCKNEQSAAGLFESLYDS